MKHKTFKKILNIEIASTFPFIKIKDMFAIIKNTEKIIRN